jgi:hypothetical protein
MPAPPRDAGTSIDAAGPTPPVAGLRLQLREIYESPQAECARTTLQLRLFDKSKNVIDEYRETSTCTGACTDEEKREGADQVERLEALIEAESESTGALDYNFTSCLETGISETQLIRKVGGRDVAIITDRYTGPHDSIDRRYKLALEVCGKLYVSQTFAEMMSRSWDIERLRVKSEGDGVIVVNGVGQTSGMLFRFTLPACPGTPREELFDVEPH